MLFLVFYRPERTFILQSNYDLRLKTVVLNSILHTKVSCNGVVFYSPNNPKLLTDSNTDSLHPSTSSRRFYFEDFCAVRKFYIMIQY